jgi:hypothetical protein
MIQEVDAALRALLRRDILNGSDVEVVFDAPTKDWAARRNAPTTVDVYLYDIREDLKRRERGWIEERDDDNQIVARRLPPRHFKLSYLVTAWTNRPEDEHRILSSILASLLLHDSIPAHLVEGELAELRLPVALTVALPPPEDRSFADVWSALGGELKPSLDVVVTAPVDTGRRMAVGPKLTRQRVGVKAKQPGAPWWERGRRDEEPSGDGPVGPKEGEPTTDEEDENARPLWAAEERSRRWQPEGGRWTPESEAPSTASRPDAGRGRRSRRRTGNR